MFLKALHVQTITEDLLGTPVPASHSHMAVLSHVAAHHLHSHLFLGLLLRFLIHFIPNLDLSVRHIRPTTDYRNDFTDYLAKSLHLNLLNVYCSHIFIFMSYMLDYASFCQLFNAR